MIGIVDYGMGNLQSVFSAFDYLGSDVRICRNPEELITVDRIVIPGVGAFKDCINRLNESGFSEALNEEVRKKGKPTLGICLGMQVMASWGTEGGHFQGLSWIEGSVVRLKPTDPQKKVPNIGWNNVKYNPEIPLFRGLPKQVDFYLVHSYYFRADDPAVVVATYDYDHTVTAAILKDNIFATQFHPEKSQDYGLKVLDNFISWKP